MDLKSLLLLGIFPQALFAVALKPRQTVTCGRTFPASAGNTCASFAASWGLTLAAFQALNPGVTCPTLVAGQSYCVSIAAASSSSTMSLTTSSSTVVSSVTTPSTITTITTITTSSSTSTSTSSTSIPSTTTTSTKTTSSTTVTTTTSSIGPNGIATPLPIQSGMATNCIKFVRINQGDTCDVVSFFNGPISTGDFVVWNSGVGAACDKLQPGTYGCIGIQTASNGIATPLPTQSGMAANCNKFVRIQPGDTCNVVSFFNGPISASDFVVWNSGAGAACDKLQADTFGCINVPKAANGVATPLPTQPGMVSNCNKFVRIQPGDTCNIVAFFNGPITMDNFVKWNTGVGGMACNNLQADTFACIGVM